MILHAVMPLKCMILPLIEPLKPTVHLNKGQVLLVNAFKGMDAFCYASMQTLHRKVRQVQLGLRSNEVHI